MNLVCKGFNSCAYVTILSRKVYNNNNRVIAYFILSVFDLFAMARKT